MSSVSAVLTMTSMNSAAVAGRKYRSAIEGGCVGSGVGVGAGSTTAMAVRWDDGQYDSEPAKVAMTVYSPGTGGVKVSL